MDFKSGTCPKCGKHNVILPSNNPLAPSICNYCVVSNLDYNNIEDGDFFCRTYNYPFNPEKWVKLAAMYKEDVFKEYISWVKEEFSQCYETETKDVWKQLNKEWGLARTHEELMHKIAPIKENYLLRNRIKWGSNYTFEELINLENLFVNTLQANDISNPMQIDAIKKACKLSVTLDRAILNGDPKEINDLSKAYQNFVKTAQIDQIITAASRDVISNVAELVSFIEEQGFEMKYYDEVERDIVDKSIVDVKEYLRRLVTDATGLEMVFEGIKAGWEKEKEMKETTSSYEAVKLEDLYQASKDRYNEEVDSELAADDVDEEFFDEDEYETLFGD